MPVAAALLSILLQADAPAAARAANTRVPQAPVCDVASHERLQVQSDRDVCAPTLNSRGKPIAMGYLPTRCRLDRMEYRIDAVGRQDECVPIAEK